LVVVVSSVPVWFFVEKFVVIQVVQLFLRMSRTCGVVWYNRAMQNADDYYSRRGNFGGSVVHRMF